jgi:ISXO2-like transposase domain
MTSLANSPGEAWCKRFVQKQLTGSGDCQTCHGRLSFKRSRDYGWCRICRIKVRPKSQTWFRSSKLTYRQIFLLLHCWQSRQSPGSTRLATGLSYTTINRWYWRFRALMPKDDQRTVLSGIVEVDEAWFGKRRFGGQAIVIGAIERDTKRLKLQVIPDTEQDSLEGFLEKHVKRGSLVVTDCSAGYGGIEWLGYCSERWNHSRGHFAGTNHIEQIWSAMKRYLRKLYGCIPTKRLQLILNEWMARHNSQRLFASPGTFLQATLTT